MDFIFCMVGVAVFKDTPYGLKLVGIFREDAFKGLVEENYFEDDVIVISLDDILTLKEWKEWRSDE